MRRWQSHKIVEGERVDSVSSFGDADTQVTLNVRGEHVRVPKAVYNRIARMAVEAGMGITSGYLVRYDDGYLSWSPAVVFEDGYTELTDG